MQALTFKRYGRSTEIEFADVPRPTLKADELLVQVIKEGIGTKGPTLSTYISIPGRYLVLMPALGRVGVSRKIEDEEARRRQPHIGQQNAQQDSDDSDHQP